MTHVGVEMCLKDKLAPKAAEEYCQLCKRQLLPLAKSLESAIYQKSSSFL